MDAGVSEDVDDDAVDEDSDSSDDDDLLAMLENM